MAFYDKIQFVYNNILQAIRENPRVDTSNFVKDFKRAVINAIKVLPEDVKKAVRLKTIPMEQQLITLINDLRNTKEPEAVVDELQYYYFFTSNDGELYKLPFKVIKQTIDEGDKMPSLKRISKKPDAISPTAQNDFFEQIPASKQKQKLKKHEFPVEATLRKRKQTKNQKVNKFMSKGPHSIYTMIGQIDDYKKKLQKQGLSKEQIRNRKDIQEMNRVLEKKITYVEQTVPLLNEQDEQKKKSKKSVKDPTDVTTYTINQLKDFMRERRIKGLTGKKAELLARVQAYLANDDEL